jgi:hypothetical protein
MEIPLGVFVAEDWVIVEMRVGRCIELSKCAFSVEPPANELQAKRSCRAPSNPWILRCLKKVL